MLAPWRLLLLRRRLAAAAGHMPPQSQGARRSALVATVPRCSAPPPAPQNVFFLKDNSYIFCAETWVFYAAATNNAGSSKVASFPDQPLSVSIDQW